MKVMMISSKKRQKVTISASTWKTIAIRNLNESNTRKLEIALIETMKTAMEITA